MATTATRRKPTAAKKTAKTKTKTSAGRGASPAAIRERRDEIQRENRNRTAAAATLQEKYFGLSIGFQWLSVERALSAEHKQTAADSLETDAKMLSTRRKLFDTRAESWERVQEVRRTLYKEWREKGFPFPVAGVRLFKREDFDKWMQKIETARDQLRDAVQAFQDVWPEIIRDAESKLGTTFDRTDYPADIRPFFEIKSEIPSLEPPEYLQTMSPEVYREQCEAVRARFAEAVTLMESTALETLNGFLENLSTRLSGTDDKGRPQQLRESAITNLRDFVNEFREKSIGSSAELDQLVARVEELATANNVDTLRDNAEARARAGELAAELKSKAADMLRARPIRKITLAGTKASTSNPEA